MKPDGDWPHMESSCERVRVAIDTNMLTSMLELKIDVFYEIKKMLGNVEFIIVKQTLYELDKISERKGGEAKKAQFAKSVLKVKEFKVEDVDAENCDEALLKISGDAVIATNDSALRKKIRKNNGKVIFIRQRKFIEMEA